MSPDDWLERCIERLRFLLTFIPWSKQGATMYRGYKVQLDDLDTEQTLDISNYIDIGKRLHDSNKEQVKNKLDSFKDKDGNLIASQIIENWFPPVKANVFLSHSHKDDDMVIGLSGYLFQKFQITSFIDSCIWGYSDDLLSLIDKEYCYRPSTNTYDYDKRNRSTSHVHMMLTIALTKMIHNCECIIFIDTPNSISPKEYIKGGRTADSPWIYSEISMTSLVRRRSPIAHRGVVAKSARAVDSLTESFQINYDVDLSHLTPLTSEFFTRWTTGKKKGLEALDALYNLDAADHEY